MLLSILQAASAAAAYAEAMQVSAAELLAAQRRASSSPSDPLRTQPDSSRGSTEPGSSARRTDAPSVSEQAAVLAHDRPAQDAGIGADQQGSDEPPPSAGGDHARRPLVHHLPGEYPEPLYDVEALQLWLLQCCQTVCFLHDFRNLPGTLTVMFGMSCGCSPVPSLVSIAIKAAGC